MTETHSGGCRHRFPDGTRCTLDAAAHAEVPGLAKVHDFRPVQERKWSAEIELTEDEIDTLVYESGPDADHDALVGAVERIITARLAEVEARIKAGPSCGVAERDHDGCYVQNALRSVRESA